MADEQDAQYTSVTEPPGTLSAKRPKGLARDQDPMDAHDPRNLKFQGTARVAQKCVARNKAGQPCGRYAVAGTTVCRFHGGNAPQVRRKAALRLAALVEPAIGVLAREMVQADKSSDKQRAANSILDRAGIARAGAPDADIARALLVDRLTALHKQMTQGQMIDVADALDRQTFTLGEDA